MPPRITYTGLRIIIIFGLAVCAFMTLGVMILVTADDAARFIWPFLGDASSAHLAIDVMITATLAVSAVKLWRLSGEYWPK